MAALWDELAACVAVCAVCGFLETPLAGGAKDRSRILHLECYGNGIDEEDAEAGLKPLV